MPTFELSGHFRYFFARINPSSSFVQTASSQYNTIKGLIESSSGLAAPLSPRCFLQGSYGQQTAIHTINDVDIVALCELWHPPSPGVGGVGKIWTRSAIFEAIAAPLIADWRYQGKVRYSSTSMCIKVDLGIKVEILPVVYKSGNFDWSREPFRLWRPEKAGWEDGYARYHQAHLSQKNVAERTGGNFIPMVKVMKHLRSVSKVSAVSFNIECLLFSVPDYCFLGSPVTYICDVLEYLAGTGAEQWYRRGLPTPCGERNIFSPDEWCLPDWQLFHPTIMLWAKVAREARNAAQQEFAIKFWQIILDPQFFPATVSA